MAITKVAGSAYHHDEHLRSLRSKIASRQADRYGALPSLPQQQPTPFTVQEHERNIASSSSSPPTDSAFVNLADLGEIPFAAPIFDEVIQSAEAIPEAVPTLAHSISWDTFAEELTNQLETPVEQAEPYQMSLSLPFNTNEDAAETLVQEAQTVQPSTVQPSDAHPEARSLLRSDAGPLNSAVPLIAFDPLLSSASTSRPHVTVLDLTQPETNASPSYTMPASLATVPEEDYSSADTVAGDQSSTSRSGGRCNKRAMACTSNSADDDSYSSMSDSAAPPSKKKRRAPPADLSKLTPEQKEERRVMSNRASAERSRQRRIARTKVMELENGVLRKEKQGLMQDLALERAAAQGLHQFNEELQGRNKELQGTVDALREQLHALTMQMAMQRTGTPPTLSVPASAG